jgi:DoxX-like family
MKTINITYWITTSIVGLMMLFSTYAYLSDPAIAAAFQHIGYPDHFRIALALAKFVGVILLAAPVAARIKEWAYAGFTFTFVGAFLAHTAAGDPGAVRIMPVIFLLLLIVSYVTYHRRNTVAAQRTAHQAA